MFSIIIICCLLVQSNLVITDRWDQKTESVMTGFDCITLPGAHYPLNHYHEERHNSYFLAALAHSFTPKQLSTQP